MPIATSTETFFTSCGFHAGRPLIPAHAGPAFHAMPG
jgi:hypothetical protein